MRLVVKGVLNNAQRGWLLDKATGKLQSDRTGDPELSDADTPLIAGQDVGVLPPQGSSDTKWRFLSTADGVQPVSLRSLGSRQPGKSKLSVKAKRWFTAAAANQPAASTELTVQIGNLCFTHAGTRKVG